MENLPDQNLNFDSVFESVRNHYDDLAIDFGRKFKFGEFENSAVKETIATHKDALTNGGYQFFGIISLRELEEKNVYFRDTETDDMFQEKLKLTPDASLKVGVDFLFYDVDNENNPKVGSYTLTLLGYVNFDGPEFPEDSEDQTFIGEDISFSSLEELEGDMRVAVGNIKEWFGF
jgi:hypothetical protein